MSPTQRISAIFSFWAGLALLSGVVQGATVRQDFAEGRITCTITSSRENPEIAATVLPIAMKAALERVGPPQEPARLEIRLLDPPPFYKRVKALFQAEAFATQTGDEIVLHPGNDPLKLAFRLGHELTHWLVYKHNLERPPLWLDEGLAQMVAAEAAETCARTRKQDLERPHPPKLESHLFSLDELVGLQAYPQATARSAAFYWQAEALVRAIYGRLGSSEFAVYLALLSAPNAPGWQVPLRERWYFSDWDMNWLAEQIRPQPKAHAAGDAP